MPTIRKDAPPPPPKADPPVPTGDETPQLSAIFYNWRKEDLEQPKSTAYGIESTVVGLLSSVETWKKEILQSADQREERLREGLRSVEALVTQTQMANSKVEHGILRALGALWDKTAELGAGLEGWSAESRRGAADHAKIAGALDALDARMAKLEETAEQRQEILAQHLGSLVEAIKATLDEAEKSSRQLQARVLRGLEAVDERMALRQQDSNRNLAGELAALFETHATTLEAAAARRASDLARHQARLHAEMLAVLEMTARKAAEAGAAAQTESRAGHTATQTILEVGLAGVARAFKQLAESVQQLQTASGGRRGNRDV